MRGKPPHRQVCLRHLCNIYLLMQVSSQECLTQMSLGNSSNPHMVVYLQYLTHRAFSVLSFCKRVLRNQNNVLLPLTVVKP